ncbi:MULTISPECIES: hypothetical protein [Staphylococcus]|uniref:Uncharacterized protein n=1 Tax=Staphylococcus nepalensis TaxID=214473 RepID=A0A291JHM0_9STAP|nr:MULTISPECIES: hypothetical protein [Staphylococcus]ATH59045.1 hypothetical protein BJD96_01140 [Staphylococcus nepalensis]ATH64136.1 hypothetical protein BJG89_01485 [Staphylococcus nepalensis]AWI43497.1 hypothetical protein BJG88_01210 [Staphylococcus nepalensis]MBO1205326.1 hypothetical protein [Staphylococcus nepalensis]PTK60356.1 hypothetical protein BUZ61_02670 [Staphylococcus nepalensis]
MFVIIQYSKGNILFYLRNRKQGPINSRVVTISKKNYKQSLLRNIYNLLSQTNNKVKDLDFLLLEMNDFKSLEVDAVCEVSRYLKMQLHKNIIVTNNIETFKYKEYLKRKER